MVMGWLLCRHWDEETQARELWHIINPELKPFVTRRDVMFVIMRLTYIAINLNQKLLRQMPDSNEKCDALEYH